MFTPVNTSLGALLLFQGSSGLLFHNGKIFGISSLLTGCIFQPGADNLPIIAGLLSSWVPVYFLAPSLIPSYPSVVLDSLRSVAGTLGLGFLVGWGTKVTTKYPVYQTGLACLTQNDIHTDICLEWSWLHVRPHALWSI